MNEKTDPKPVHPLRRALRDEMFSVLNQGELTPAMCSTLMRIAESAREILRAGTMKPEDFVEGTEHVGDQEAQPVNTETFGVKMVKELMPFLQAKFNPKPQVDTAQLVIALAEARKHGLKDVEADLMAQLGLARPDGTVPVGGPWSMKMPGAPVSAPIPIEKSSDGFPIVPLTRPQPHLGVLVQGAGYCSARDCWCSDPKQVDQGWGAP